MEPDGQDFEPISHPLVELAQTIFEFHATFTRNDPTSPAMDGR
jgi:hypothetical protein